MIHYFNFILVPEQKKNGIYFSVLVDPCWPPAGSCCLLLKCEITCILLIYYSIVYVFISSGVGRLFHFSIVIGLCGTVSHETTRFGQPNFVVNSTKL